jgi:hypothetical protein
MLEISQDDWETMWRAFYNKDDATMTDLAWEHFRIPPTLAIRYMTRLSNQSDADRPKGAKLGGKPTRADMENAHNARFITLLEARTMVQLVPMVAKNAWESMRRSTSLPSQRPMAERIYSLLRSIGYADDQIAEMDNDIILAKMMEVAVMPAPPVSLVE